MKRLFVWSVLLCTFFASVTLAQHSLQLDAGGGKYGIILGAAAWPVGTTIYTMPPGGGTIVTNTTFSNMAWALGGNTAPSSNIFGTLDATNVDMRANNTTQLTLRSAGGIELPATTSAGVGVLFQNGLRLLHTFGTDNLFVGLNAGNFTLTSANNAVGLGPAALSNISTGDNNTALGAYTMVQTTIGADNTAVGYNVLNLTTTGVRNTGVGSFALDANMTGADNVAVGYNALTANTSSNLTAVGASALAANTSGPNNTAVGSGSLMANTTGGQNTSVGVNALSKNVGASENTAMGYLALFNNTAGALNTGIGSNALAANSTGNNNTGVGAGVLQSNDGDGNTAVGRQAMFSNSTGDFNTAIGELALNANTTGISNTAVGRNALLVTTGGGNTASGAGAGNVNTTGSDNTFIGSFANASVNNLSNATAIGANAVVTASNTIQLGDGAVTNVNTAGRITSATATHSALPNLSSATDVVVAAAGGVLETRTAASLTGATAWALGGNTAPSSNIFGTLDATNVDMRAGNTTQLTLLNAGGIDLPATTAAGVGVVFKAGTRFIHAFGFNNFFAGAGAGNLTMTGASNTAVGVSVLSANTTGGSNTAVGRNVLQNNTTGSANSAVGSDALTQNITGINNTAMGYGAMAANITGSANAAFGSQALTANLTGFFNTAIGEQALLITTGTGNTASGAGAGNVNTVGGYNTFIGYQANPSANNLTNATAIGNGAIVTASNTIQLGNTSVTNVNTAGSIAMTGANRTLTFTGNSTGVTTFAAGTQGATNITYTLPTTQAAAAGQVLTNDGAGVLSWSSSGGTAETYGSTSPAAIAANTNDYALVTGTATHYRISSTAAFNITGIVAAADGRVIILTNVGANNITLTHLDAGSAAANQFRLPGGFNITIGQDGAATLIYDATTGAWRLVSTN